jgi:hypothetical protein
MDDKTPVMWKRIEIQETYVKRDGKVYWKWRFAKDKRWNYRLTAHIDIPYVLLNMPHPLVYPPKTNER